MAILVKWEGMSSSGSRPYANTIHRTALEPMDTGLPEQRVATREYTTEMPSVLERLS
jgi:hypothetical protein